MAASLSAMKIRTFVGALIAASALTAPATAQDAEETAVTPGSVVQAADPSEWKEIPAEDLLVMTLTPDGAGKPREVIIQLTPDPISSAWTANIRTMAKARWWDGLSIYRSVDNWVVQWGDGEDPENPEPKPLPDGIAPTSEGDYAITWQDGPIRTLWGKTGRRGVEASGRFHSRREAIETPDFSDPYSDAFSYIRGIPVAVELGSYVVADGKAPMMTRPTTVWPVHCYASVGVARDLSPDAGTGAELYAVIGHAPRQLDRNIAVVGKVIEGIEHMSILPRGTGEYGVYETEAEHTPIVSVRLASELPENDRPRFRYLDTESESFAKFADVVANRNDAFYKVAVGGADVCNVRVPVVRIED